VPYQAQFYQENRKKRQRNHRYRKKLASAAVSSVFRVDTFNYENLQQQKLDSHQIFFTGKLSVTSPPPLKQTARSLKAKALLLSSRNLNFV